MKTKLLMGSSALLMGSLGVATSFLPQEILLHFGSPPEGFAVLVIQIMGALYLGSAMQNWMSRENLIGGIYNRPLALANFFHFAVVSTVLLKAWLGGGLAPALVVGALVYTVFAVGFALTLFTSPVKGESNS